MAALTSSSRALPPADGQTPTSTRAKVVVMAHLGRPEGGELHVRSATSSVHVPDLADAASVVIASEKLDGENGWRMLAPGEIVHVRPDLGVESWIAVPEPPAHLVPLPPGNPNIDT